MLDSGSEADSNQALTLRRSNSSSITEESRTTTQVTVKQETNTSDDKHLNESGKSGESGNENSHHSLVNSKTVKRKRNLSSPVKLPETKRRIIQNSSSDEGESSDASDSEQDSSDSDKEDSDRSVISSNSDEDSKTPAKAAQKSKAISPATSDRKKIEKENQPSSTKKRSREKEGSRIRKLQRYLKEAGIRVKNYTILWEGCKSARAKCRKLLDLLEEHGLKGNPTVVKCQKLRMKRETEEDIAELNLGNIINSETGRPRRGAFSLYASSPSHSPRETKKTKKKSQMNDSKESPEPKKHFSRLKRIIDSDDSD